MYYHSHFAIIRVFTKLVQSTFVPDTTCVVTIALFLYLAGINEIITVIIEIST